jgi:predicted ATP-grasp superfamily ATP-dependent carboligase
MLLYCLCLQAEQYRGDSDPSQEFLAFLLQSTPARQPAAAAAAAAPYLPSGSVVSGLPAALISQAELREVPAELLVVVESVPALVPATLQELSAVISKALKGVLGGSGADTGGGWALLRLQQEGVVGAARAKLQQGSCRPTSVYS